MIRWPIFAIPVVLAAKRRFVRIEEFTFAFGLALIATTIVSALVPAIGVYQQIGLDPASVKNVNVGAYLDQLRDLPPTREGVLRHLELLGLGGIVTFPSFHAASAVLYSWALWPMQMDAADRRGGVRRHAGGNADQRRPLFHRHFRRCDRRRVGDRRGAPRRSHAGAAKSRRGLAVPFPSPCRRSGA